MPDRLKVDDAEIDEITRQLLERKIKRLERELAEAWIEYWHFELALCETNGAGER